MTPSAGLHSLVVSVYTGEEALGIARGSSVRINSVNAPQSVDV
jgi:hypothetical protein